MEKKMEMTWKLLFKTTIIATAHIPLSATITSTLPVVMTLTLTFVATLLLQN